MKDKTASAGISRGGWSQGLDIAGGVIGGLGGILQNRASIAHANKVADHNYEMAVQGVRDKNAELASLNKFDTDTRNYKIDIANKYLLPQIRESAQQSYYAIALGQYQADQQDAFIRGEMNRKFTEQHGTNIASLGAGNRTGQLAGAKMTAGARGRMLQQMSEKGMGRRAQGQLAMNKTALQAQRAATEVVAPLHMPQYKRKMLSMPKRGPRQSSDFMSELMIMGGSVMGGIANAVA